MRHDGLDLIGQRWALQILVALLPGPLRFSDLRRALPSIGAKILSLRLREMVEAQLVSRVALQPPASGSVYTLTPESADLRVALLLLDDWQSQRASGRAD